MDNEEKKKKKKRRRRKKHSVTFLRKDRKAAQMTVLSMEWCIVGGLGHFINLAKTPFNLHMYTNAVAWFSYDISEMRP